VHGYRAAAAFDGERLLPGGALVLVEGERIVGVEPAHAAAPADCPVTEVPGTTLLPGLIDAHTHLCADSGPHALDQLPELDPAALAAVISASLQIELAAGVTTVRDLGDIGYAVLAHRGDRLGPSVLASGPPITSVGGHCAGMGGEAAGTDGLRRAVADRAERGVDVVKVMASGGIMTTSTDPAACQFTPDELRAVVDEAHRFGLPVTAHAHPTAAVRRCVDAGVDGIEHCTCFSADSFDATPDLVDRIAAAGIVVCPTLGRRALTAALPQQIKAFMDRTGFTFEGRLAQVAELYRGGVRLISGADSGISPGKPHGLLPGSIADLVELGMPPADALASATSLAADGIGLGTTKGRLRTGYDADLLFVAGDPLSDIDALGAAAAIVCRGTPV
jgi:imidazolonepropionase-like amidohydrolase